MTFKGIFLFFALCVSAFAQGPQSVTINSLPAVSVTRDWLDWAAFVCSFVLTLVGIIGVAAALRTLNAVKKQADEMVHQAQLIGEQTAVAKDAADAAKLNAKALINSERPWLLTEPALTGDKQYLRMTFQGTNVGRSPAEIILSGIEHRTHLFGEELRNEPFFSESAPVQRQWAHTQWIAPGAKFWLDPFDLNNEAGEIWELLWSGTYLLNVMGFVRYRDAISNGIHESRFCYLEPVINFTRVT
jgi:hypothetical protein